MVRKLWKPVLFLSVIALATLPWIRTAASSGGSGHSRCHDCRCSRLDYFDRLLPPTLPGRGGQDALGAVQRTVGLLLADPRTDWSEVRIKRLRQHLADLNEIMMRAEAEERGVPGGLEITVGGQAGTSAAVQRVVPEHARRMDGFRGWSVAAETVVDETGGESVVVTISSSDPDEVEVVRGLGFFGFLASGVHHPQSHLAVARGKAVPAAP